MSKQKAVTIHFLFSLAVVSTLLAIIFFIWYPAPMFRINGAANILKILVGVDLVLGPMLTAYLYRPGKKGLWIDMWFIAIVQIGALVYGATTIYQERPQFMVFSQDRYVVLAGKDVIDGTEPRQACEIVDSLPCRVVAIVGDSVEARSSLLEKTLKTGAELEQLAEYWQPFDKHRSKVLAKARPLQAIIDASPAVEDAVKRLSNKHDRALSDMVYVPVINKNLVGFCLIIDAETAETLDVIAVDPWEME
ncbi:MAG: hypothetical protein AB8F65_02515 [Woeseiaceae bacterium]